MKTERLRKEIDTLQMPMTIPAILQFPFSTFANSILLHVTLVFIIIKQYHMKNLLETCVSVSKDVKLVVNFQHKLNLQLHQSYLGNAIQIISTIVITGELKGEDISCFSVYLFHCILSKIPMRHNQINRVASSLGICGARISN